VATRALFADPGGAGRLRVDVDLDDLAEPLHGRLAAFRAARVELGPRTFAGVVPDGDRLAALLANLQFNGYRDETGNYRDPAAVAALHPSGFALAPGLEPLRHDLLAAMQDQLGEVRAQLCTVTADDLRPLVDTALAARTVAALEGAWLEDGALRPELWPLLPDRAGDSTGTATSIDDLPPLPADLPRADCALVPSAGEGTWTKVMLRPSRDSGFGTHRPQPVRPDPRYVGRWLVHSGPTRAHSRSQARALRLKMIRRSPIHTAAIRLQPSPNTTIPITNPSSATLSALPGGLVRSPSRSSQIET
jgi:hypothetical protein